MSKGEKKPGVPGRNKSHELTDHPGQALESGEPSQTGRSHGHIIDRHGSAITPKPAKNKGNPHNPADPEIDQDYESGRHDAAP